MKRLFILLAGMVLLLQPAAGKVRVHTIGDSTMADYDESTTDRRGWGTYLGSFFDAQAVEVSNWGKSGASTRTFYEQAAYWPSVKQRLTAGDYVLIQFAHNDENNDGVDAVEYNDVLKAAGKAELTDLRGTHPQTTYKAYLRHFVEETTAAGCIPVLVAPICRKYFDGNTIRRNGRHDLGDKFSKLVDGVLVEKQSVEQDDHSMDYVYAMRQVAEETNTAFIDLTSATKELYEQYGEQKCTELLFCQTDNTHTATLGANLIARLAAQLLRDSAVLAEHVRIPVSISASPASLTIGETYAGVAVKKEVLLTGFGLVPESGSLTVTASSGLTISADNVTFGQTATVSYAGSTLFQRIYIRTAYEKGGEATDSLTIVSGERRIVVPVTASVLSLSGGTAVRAYWAVDNRPVPPAEVTGPITAEFGLSNMVATDIKDDFTDGTEQGLSMVRIHNADASGQKTKWPIGEIDENASRYIDFAVTAPTTMKVRITGISMTIASHSTSTMCCHINTGFGDEFTNVKTVYERKNLPDRTLVDIALTPVLEIEAGQTLHVRILPWHDSNKEGSGKYLCVKNVQIEGMAFEPESPTALEEKSSTMANAEKVWRDGSIRIVRDGREYTLTGVQLR